MQKELNHKVRKCFNDRAGWDPPDLYDHRNTDHGHGHRFLYNISCKWVISGSRS